MNRTGCGITGAGSRRGRSALIVLFAVFLPLSGQVRGEDVSSPHQGSPTYQGAKLIWPSGAVAFPTGRFAKTDTKANPPKAGNKTGWNFGGDIGYFVNEYVAVGAGYDYGRFNIDFGSDSVANLFPTRLARTSVSTVQVWARFFPPRGYSHWRPYVLVAIGVGRPVGTIEYESSVPIDTFQVVRLDSKVKMSAVLTAGIGALVPMSSLLSGSMEARYCKISTKAVERTDHMTTQTGQSIDVNYDDGGNHLKSKSDTNWWELRGGLVLMIK